MQAIKQIQALNKRELENAVPPSASWHADYRDTAYVYIGGLDTSLSEGDVITIFSQFGEPTHINLIRDKETGKSKGYGFLKYEDQRSTDLAVDNLSGSVVVKGSMQLRVEHARYEKRKREGAEEEEMDNVRWDKVLGIDVNTNGEDATDDDSKSDRERIRERKRRRHLLKDEADLDEKDAEDPMRDYMDDQRRDEVDKALGKEDKRHGHRHRHRERDGHRNASREGRAHRHHRHRPDSEDPSESREHRHRSDRSRRSRDRRPSRDRDAGSTSPPRHRRRHHEKRRHRSRSLDRRD